LAPEVHCLHEATGARLRTWTLMFGFERSGKEFLTYERNSCEETQAQHNTTGSASPGH
jgi:hypothetical protein